ncbi:unnamed protein product, partial [marine sediment metagenome]
HSFLKSGNLKEFLEGGYPSLPMVVYMLLKMLT